MTPDGTPIVGATGYPNLYTNTAHGTLSWTMACGSARVLTDLIEEGDRTSKPQTCRSNATSRPCCKLRTQSADVPRRV